MFQADSHLSLWFPALGRVRAKAWKPLQRPDTEGVTGVSQVSPRPTMSRLNLHVPVLGAAESTGLLEDQQLLVSAGLSHVREAAGRSVSIMPASQDD